MTGRSFFPNRGILLASACLSLACSTSAIAEGYSEPEYKLPDLKGVDLASGLVYRDDPLLTIGATANPLSWNVGVNDGFSVILYLETLNFVKKDYNENYCCDDHAYVKRFRLNIGNKVTYFYKRCPGNVCSDLVDEESLYSGSRSNAYIKKSGNYLIYIDRKGFQIYLKKVNNNRYAADFIKKPNGESIYFNYYFYKPTYTSNVWTYPECSAWDDSCTFILRSVVRSDGYAIRYNYNISSGIQPSFLGVSSVNLARHRCDAAALDCEAYDGTVSAEAMSFVYQTTYGEVPISGGNGSTYRGRKYVDAVGAEHSYVFADATLNMDADADSALEGAYGNVARTSLFYYKSPLGEETRVVYTGSYSSGSRKTDFSDSSGLWRYTFSKATSGKKTISALDPDGNTFVAAQVVVNRGVFSYLQDGLGRQTNYTYYGEYIPGTEDIFAEARAAFALFHIQTVEDPELDTVTYDYDNRGNVVEIDQAAKPGSGFANIVQSATYEAGCATVTTCNRPLTLVDGRSSTTTFTYSAVHGQVLTETGPADSQGIHPQTRYEYAALYGKRLNTSGVMESFADPIYKVTRKTVCRSSLNSCAGTSDEFVVTYAYDDNLLLSSQEEKAGDGSLISRITYGYDVEGNRVQTDGPRTDVDDRTYATFDAVRRPIFEIGPDPDGSGPLKRPVVKHYYDADSHEIRTETGTGNATDGSDFVATSFKSNSYDAMGRVVKTVAGWP